MWARRVAPKGPSAEQATCLSGLLVSLVRSQAEPHLYRHSPLEVGPQCPAAKPRKIVMSPEATNPNASNSELPLQAIPNCHWCHWSPWAAVIKTFKIVDWVVPPACFALHLTPPC